MSKYSDRTVLNAQAANGASSAFNIEDADQIAIQVDSASNANLTLKFVASGVDDAPTFSTAQSATNPFDYVAVQDKRDLYTIIDGDTGLVLSGTDDNRLFILDTKGLKWFGAVVSGLSAGNVTVKIRTDK